MGRKLWGLLCSFPWGELGPHLTKYGLGPGLPRNKWHIDPSSRFATIDTRLRFTGADLPASVNRESGGVAGVPFSVGGKLAFHLTRCRLGRGVLPYQVAS